jgi:TPR repeat protein
MRTLAAASRYKINCPTVRFLFVFVLSYLLLMPRSSVGRSPELTICFQNETPKCDIAELLERVPNEPGFPALGATFRAHEEALRARPDLAHLEGGVEVTGVHAGGPAERAGLETGDVIVELGGRTVKDTQTFSQQMQNYAPGDEVALHVWRAAGFVEITVELADARDVCGSGGGWGCNLLAARYYIGDGVERNVETAAALYQQACELDDPNGCFNLGVLHQNGEGVARDMSMTMSLCRKACDLGLGAACLNLGYLYARSEGGEKDLSKAATFYEQACGLSSAVGCHEMAVSYANGWGVEKDPVKAGAMYQKACDLGFAGACHNLAFMFARGAGADKDLAKAAVLYERACDWGVFKSCSSLGMLYEQGEGVTQDLTRAAELYQKACDGGDRDGCRGLLRVRE